MKTYIGHFLIIFNFFFLLSCGDKEFKKIEKKEISQPAIVLSCGGFLPENTLIDHGENSPKTEGQNWHYTQEDPSQECEFRCKSNYTWTGSSCLQNTQDDGPQTETYHWHYETYGECSKDCGSGVQNRVVYCIKDSDNSQVGDSFCTDTKPDVSRACNTQNCPQKKCHFIKDAHWEVIEVDENGNQIGDSIKCPIHWRTGIMCTSFNTKAQCCKETEVSINGHCVPLKNENNSCYATNECKPGHYCDNRRKCVRVK